MVQVIFVKSDRPTYKRRVKKAQQGIKFANYTPVVANNVDYTDIANIENPFSEYNFNTTYNKPEALVVPPRTDEVVDTASDAVVNKPVAESVVDNASQSKWSSPYKDRSKWVADLTSAYKRAGITNDNAIKMLLAQDALESGWGRSAQGKFNFGNLTTGSSWKGNYVDGRDKNAKGEAIKQKFRSYNSIDEYAADKVQFLKRLYDFNETDDINRFTAKLTGANKGKRRYAEATNYANSLRGVYNSFKDGGIIKYDGGGKTYIGTTRTNNYGDKTHYFPVYNKDGMMNVGLPEVTITPRNTSIAGAVDRGRREAAPYVGTLMAGAVFGPLSVAGGYAGTEGVNKVTDATSGGKYKTWGDMVSDMTGLNPTLSEFTNPGALLGGVGVRRFGPTLKPVEDLAVSGNKWARARMINKTLGDNVKKFDGTVSPEYFKAQDKWYRVTETPEVYGIKEVGKNVTTKDAVDIHIPSDKWRRSVIDNKLTPVTDNGWARETKRRFGLSKGGQAHGNTSQAAKGQIWGGTFAKSGKFPNVVLEGNFKNNVYRGFDPLTGSDSRTNFVLQNWESIPTGARLGFHTGEMPIEGLKAFQQLPNGRFSMEPVVPYKVTKQPVAHIQPTDNFAIFNTGRQSRISRMEANGIPKGERNQPIKSSLDWKSWSEGGPINKKHLAEYAQIEKEAKYNGNWLLTEDGKPWEGDPRTWVQLMSKNGRKFKKGELPSNDDMYYHGIDKTANLEPERMQDMYLAKDWGRARSYTNKDDIASPNIKGGVLHLGVPNTNEPLVVDANNAYWTNIISPFTGKSTSTDIIRNQAYDRGYNSVYLKNVIDNGPNWRAGTNPLQPSDELVVNSLVPRKSLVGNNGDFNINNPNIYKVLAPFLLTGGMTYEHDK